MVKTVAILIKFIHPDTASLPSVTYLKKVNGYKSLEFITTYNFFFYFSTYFSALFMTANHWMLLSIGLKNGLFSIIQTQQCRYRQLLLNLSIF